MCDDVEWINGLSYPISESYHPNRAGHSSGYTPTVSPLLTGSTVTASASLLSAASRTADTLATQQRRYAAADRSIGSERFVAPDLHSPRALRAARLAGVDVDDPASVAAADRRYSTAQARAWAAHR